MPNKARNDQPEWVIGLKSVIRTTCGSAWRVSPQSGKVKLDIRLDDGSRRYKTLAIPWDRAHGRRIQETIEEIHQLTERGFSIDDAIERVKVIDAPKVVNEGNAELLKDAWAKYEIFKVKTDGILQKTWNKEYGGEAHDEDDDALPKRIKAGGKTYNNLLKVINASSPEDMFIKLAQNNGHKSGARMREQVIRNIAAFLRWGTGYESNYLLPEKWKPFAKGDAGTFIGKKSGADIKEEKKAIPIETEDIYKLLKSINVNQPNKRHAAAAKGWKYMIELASAYGLRPEELRDLKFKDGELWSMWIKKSGGGTGKPRMLCSWPEELAEEWDLVNRFKNKEPYPEIKTDRGIGEAMSNYLKRNDVWMKMKKEKGYTTRSFRHGYSRRCHKLYGMGSDEVAQFMGHDEQTHIDNYTGWFKNEDLEDLKNKYKKKK